MATSGTTSFTVTRDDIINAALRLVGAFGDGDSVPASDITNCAQALNILAKELATDGLPLWCVQTITIPMVVGQTSYNLSTASNTTLPIRVLDAYLRTNSNASDVVLVAISRYDYDKLGGKTTQGVPNQYFYDPQLTAGNIILYNVPADTGHTLYAVIQRQIQDFNLATDNPDFPQEAFRLLKWCLADEIALEYGARDNVRAEISQKCKYYKDKFFDYEQEQASITFTPNGPQRYGYR